MPSKYATTSNVRYDENMVYYVGYASDMHRSERGSVISVPNVSAKNTQE